MQFRCSLRNASMKFDAESMKLMKFWWSLMKLMKFWWRLMKVQTFNYNNCWLVTFMCFVNLRVASIFSRSTIYYFICGGYFKKSWRKIGLRTCRRRRIQAAGTENIVEISSFLGFTPFMLRWSPYFGPSVHYPLSASCFVSLGSPL